MQTKNTQGATVIFDAECQDTSVWDEDDYITTESKPAWPYGGRNVMVYYKIYRREGSDTYSCVAVNLTSTSWTDDEITIETSGSWFTNKLLPNYQIHQNLSNLTLPLLKVKIMQNQWLNN